MHPPMLFCRNIACPSRGLQDQDNIRVHDNLRQRYRCTTCTKTFRITDGTLFHGRKYPSETITRVSTAYIERLNATFRARCHSLVRRRRGLARQASTLKSGMYLVGCLYNFCTPHQSLQREDGAYTPAMAAGLTSHLWSVGELLSYRFAPPPFVAKKKRGRKPKSESPSQEGGNRVVTGQRSPTAA